MRCLPCCFQSPPPVHHSRTPDYRGRWSLCRCNPREVRPFQSPRTLPRDCSPKLSIRWSSLPAAGVPRRICDCTHFQRAAFSQDLEPFRDYRPRKIQAWHHLGMSMSVPFDSIRRTSSKAFRLCSQNRESHHASDVANFRSRHLSHLQPCRPLESTATGIAEY